jgi:hypothetical protein
MEKQQPKDFALLLLGLVLAIASVTPWIRILVISVDGTATWWGYVTLFGGLAIAFYAATLLWPNFIDRSIGQYGRIVSVIAIVASLCVLGYVGVRLNQASQQFNSEMAKTSNTEPSGLGSEFDSSMQSFSDSLSKAFQPSLAIGWYMSVVAGVGSLVLVLRRRETPAPVTIDTSIV